MVTNYTKGMKDSEVYERMNQLYALIDPNTATKKKHCQYIGKTKDRHCIMTTLKSCEKCKMFTPTTQSKMRMLIEQLLATEKENRRLIAEISLNQRDIAELQLRVKNLQFNIEMLRKENDERRICEDNDDD